MLDNDHLFKRILEILEHARHKVYRTANTEMLRAYWNVGREIVVEEQKGQDRAKYGRGLIKDLSIRLTKEYGRGFTETNLKYMRQFYLTFEKRHALSDELSWTHYGLLVKGECKRLTESDLEAALIDKLQNFILELVNGFSFVGREYRITVDNEHYYIDLLFYNFML